MYNSGKYFNIPYRCSIKKDYNWQNPETPPIMEKLMEKMKTIRIDINAKFFDFAIVH